MSRATTAQKGLLLQLLTRHGMVSRRLSASDRTGPMWRALFRAAGTREPGNPFDWPTVDQWIGGLSVEGASGAIACLHPEARKQ